MRPRHLSALFLLAMSAAAASAPSAKEQAEAYWPGIILQPMSTREYQRLLQEFAQCLLDEKPAEVRALLALPADSPKIHDAAVVLAGKDNICSPNVWWTGDSRSIRYALVEALYNRDFHGSRNGVPSVQLGSDAGRLEPINCVVRSGFAVADHLVITAPASKEQKAAFAALQPYLEACGRKAPRDQEAQRWLRYQIAEALYRQRSATVTAGVTK